MLTKMQKFQVQFLTKINYTNRKFAKTIYKTFNRVYTRKNAQVVTNLQQTCSNAVPTTCQQDVFALLVPSLLTSCQRLVDNLLQGCWAQQTCYKLFQQPVIVLIYYGFYLITKYINCIKCIDWHSTLEILWYIRFIYVEKCQSIQNLI
jgi:hypothetical protein